MHSKLRMPERERLIDSIRPLQNEIETIISSAFDMEMMIVVGAIVVFTVVCLWLHLLALAFAVQCTLIRFSNIVFSFDTFMIA